MVNIRCSSLDQLMACPPSVFDDRPLRVDTARVEAEQGNVVHALAAEYVERGCFDIKNECARQGFKDPDAIAELMGYVVRAWDELKRFFSEPQTERRIGSDPVHLPSLSFVLSGTLDVVSATRKGGAVFLDWKSGFDDAGYHNQMAGYAWLLWLRLGKPQDVEIVGVVVFLQKRYYRIVRYDARSIEQWADRLNRNVLEQRQTFTTGAHCAYCPIYASCDARLAQTQSTITALLSDPSSLQAEQNPGRRFIAKAQALIAAITEANKSEPEVALAMNELVYRLRLAQKAIDDAKQLVRDAVARVGPIPVGAQVKLAFRTVEKKVIDGTKALRVLRSHLSDHEILGAAKISLPTVLAAKAAKFARGEKGDARKQLEKELDAAGALRIESHQRLEEVDDSEPDPKLLPGDPDGTAANAPGPAPRADDPERDRPPARTGQATPERRPGDGASGGERPQP